VLPFVIANSQSAFVPGHLITDNVLVVFEVMHSMSQKRKGRRGQMAIKLDMSKAYEGHSTVPTVFLWVPYPLKILTIHFKCFNLDRLFLLKLKPVTG
jgi:hypothetical protein